MADEHEHIRALPVRVSRLETWAGPGPAEALATGLRAVRTDAAVIRRVQVQHTAALAGLARDVAGLKSGMAVLEAGVAGLKDRMGALKPGVAVLKADVAVLREDLGEVKAMLAEVLRRLPPAAG